MESVILPDDLRQRLASWNSRYDDSKLSVEGGGNEDYLKEGRKLLAELRHAVADRYDVIVHEDWWGEPGLPFRQPGWRRRAECGRGRERR